MCYPSEKLPLDVQDTSTLNNMRTSEVAPLLGNTQNTPSTLRRAREDGDTYLSFPTEFPTIVQDNSNKQSRKPQQNTRDTIIIISIVTQQVFLRACKTHLLFLLPNPPMEAITHVNKQVIHCSHLRTSTAMSMHKSNMTLFTISTITQSRTCEHHFKTAT